MLNTSFIKATFLLSLQDFSLKYKLSVLGIVWSVISPAIHILTLTIVFSHFLRFGIDQYPVYLSCGVLSWQLITGTIKATSNSLINNRHLLLNTKSPLYIYIFSASLAEFYRFVISAYTILFLLNFIYELSPLSLLVAILALPIFFICSFIGLSLALIVPKYRDLPHIIDILLTSLYWSVPVFYTIDMLSDDIKTIISYNPFYWLVRPIQGVVYYNKLPDFLDLMHLVLLFIIFLFLGLYLKSKSKMLNFYI